MKESIQLFLHSLYGSARDLLPIVLVIAFFQIIVLQQAPDNLVQTFVGLIFVVLGLTFFIFGLEQGLFPIGESMAYDFASKGSATWLLLFAFSLGFGTTIAEPALIAVAEEASKVAAGAGLIVADTESMNGYADGLRFTVALSVGFAIALGVLRILLNWSIQYIIMAGYAVVIVLTGFAPEEIIGIA